MLHKVKTQNMNVADQQVTVQAGMKYLGIYLDQQLSMKHHIQQKVKIAATNIRRISFIRKFINIDTAKL